MFINLTKTEVEETITALEDLQTYLEENGMEDCTRCNLEIVKSVRGRLMKELLIQVVLCQDLVQIKMRSSAC